MKLAEAVESDTSNLPNQVFADSLNREFPLNTKEATILSAAYASRQHNQDPVIVERIRKAAGVWSCLDEVDSLMDEVKNRVPTPKFAVDVNFTDSQIQHFPFYDDDSFKTAADKFYDNRSKFPRLVRKSAAESILTEATHLGVELSDHTLDFCEKSAGLGLFDKHQFNIQVLIRKHAATKGEAEKIAQLVEISGLLDENDKYAAEYASDALSAYDEETGYSSRYGVGAQLPEEVVIGHALNKMAGLTDDYITLANGATVDVNDIDWQKVSEFDPELASEVGGDLQKAAEILPTWPRPDADTLVEMLGLEVKDV